MDLKKLEGALKLRPGSVGPTRAVERFDDLQTVMTALTLQALVEGKPIPREIYDGYVSYVKKYRQDLEGWDNTFTNQKRSEPLLVEIHARIARADSILYVLGARDDEEGG